MELIIDGHSHVTYPLDAHIAEMDKNGVTKTVLFRTIIHPERANDYSALKQEMNTLGHLLSGDATVADDAAEKSHAELLDAIKRYPDRYIGFGFVSPFLSKEESVQRIQNDIIAHDLDGLGEYTLASGTILQLHNLFYACSVCGNFPIWIHAFNPLIWKDIQDIDALAKAYPSIPVIIGHMGGSHWLETIELACKRANLFLDISAFFSTLALQMTINTIPEKCIFGVDRPYGDLALAIQAVKMHAKSTYVSRCVFGGTIQSILG